MSTKAKEISINIKKLILLAVSGIIILMLSDIPYVNLVADIRFLLFIIFLLAFLVFRSTSKIAILTFFAVLLYALLLTLLGQGKEAQEWGDYGFLILVIALVKYFWENRKEI